MNVLKKLGRSGKAKLRPERGSPAYLEGLPEELLRSEYPMEYNQIRKERAFLVRNRAWHL